MILLPEKNDDLIENGREPTNTFSNRFTSIAEEATGIPLENKFDNLEDDTRSVKSITKQYKNLLSVFEIEINLLNPEVIFEFSKAKVTDRNSLKKNIATVPDIIPLFY